METDLHIHEASLLPGGANNPHTAARAEAGGTGPDEPGFFDTVLDIVNPLQHLPIISDIYRELTGDTLAPAARLVGGALYGGPIGFASSLVNAVIEQDSGQDVGSHAMAMLGIGGDDPTPYIAQAPAENARELAAATNATPVASAPASPVRPPAPAAGDRALSLSKTDRQTQAMRLARAEREAAEAAARDLAGPAGGDVTTGASPGRMAQPPATDIFWSGERVIPEPGGPVVDLAGSDEAALAASAARPVAASPAASAAAPPDRQAANAAWLAAAFEDARSLREANDTGAPAERPEAQPWVASAMSAALDKYEAMARQRAAAPGTSVSR